MSTQETSYKEFPTQLENIPIGCSFMMLLYNEPHMRVAAYAYGSKLEVSQRYKPTHPFNDDGHHVPIVNLATGHLFWMSKKKPCRVLHSTVDWSTLWY